MEGNLENFNSLTRRKRGKQFAQASAKLSTGIESMTVRGVKLACFRLASFALSPGFLRL